MNLVQPDTKELMVKFNQDSTYHANRLMELQSKIEEFVEETSPTKDQTEQLIDLANGLELILREGGLLAGKEFEVVIFGSLLNALYDCGTSDLDLTIIFDDDAKDANCDHEEVLGYARNIFQKLKRPDLKFTDFKGPFWQQSGAILKFKVTMLVG
jgi:DNA polymerase sigma